MKEELRESHLASHSWSMMWSERTKTGVKMPMAWRCYPTMKTEFLLEVYHIRNFRTFLHRTLEESPDYQPTLTSEEIVGGGRWWSCWR